MLFDWIVEQCNGMTHEEYAELFTLILHEVFDDALD